jgi:hypothetical protein
VTSERDSWLRLSDEELLKQCRQEYFRSSGPGGQHRNKVETGVRLQHMPSGVVAQSADLRLRSENLKRAIRRLRSRIAFEVRGPGVNGSQLPKEFLSARSGDKLTIGARNSSFPIVAATSLDALAASAGSYARASSLLGVTTSQLLGFLKSDRELWREAEALRTRVRG